MTLCKPRRELDEAQAANPDPTETCYRSLVSEGGKCETTATM